MQAEPSGLQWRGGLPVLVPDWPVPACVHAYATTRRGGCSGGDHASLNLSTRVGDDPNAVAANRAHLAQALALPHAPCWLQQVHGTRVVDESAPEGSEADGRYSLQTGVICAVQTADCLPVLLCDEDGTAVAALHAGWRGLVAGVLEAGVRALPVPPARLLAWLGPAIGSAAFEVGMEVRQAFLAVDPGAHACFMSGREFRWQADLYDLARRRLQQAGVNRIYGGSYCTHSQSDWFYSYRRQVRCGRMASLIWLS
jgi:YfiH family protein